MPIPEISSPELAALLAGPDRPALLDVRFPHEHALVALPDSLLIPLPELEERQDELEVLRDRDVVVYCHHGVRSLDGAAFLNALGYRARSLRGGIDAYARQIDPRLPLY